MLKFRVFDNGRPAIDFTLRNAYLLGSDDSALRADITFDNGMIICQKRDSGPASLALQQHVGELGELTIQTCLLPEKDEPYLLSVEMARHGLMLLYNKLEEWGMFDLDAEHAVTRRMDLARKRFIEALAYQAEEPDTAVELAEECLITAIDACEELALAHAALLLSRRKATDSVPQHAIGCGVALDQTTERIRAGLTSNFDFLNLPTPWRELVPQEGEYRWEILDNWTEWATRNHLRIVAGPLIRFDPSFLPDWIYIWEHDYETIRDLLYEHTERVVTRYRDVVSGWNVVSGIHVNNHFTFTFDQLLDLTRMSTMLVKKIHPNASIQVEIRQPFGEYYSLNQRSIPPLMYADLMIQGAIRFDGFVIRLLMGQAVPGQFTRDLMQLGSIVDQFASFGKPVHLAVAVPSDMVTKSMLAKPDSNGPIDPNCGYWRKPWSQMVQSRWLEAIYQILMSRPYVESVAWHEFMDHPNIELPLAGLVGQDQEPKQAFSRLVSFRRSLNERQEPSAASLDMRDEG